MGVSVTLIKETFLVTTPITTPWDEDASIRAKVRTWEDLTIWGKSTTPDAVTES